MGLSAQDSLAKVGGNFGIKGELVDVERCAGGHINDSYAATYLADGERTRYLHQRLNTSVFQQPVELMQNVDRVLVHLGAKEAASEDGHVPLQLLRTESGQSCVVDNGDYWRCFTFVEGGVARDTPESAAQVREAARMFGRFSGMLADLPAPRLHETVVDFHKTPARFAAFDVTCAADRHGRAAVCATEIEFARGRKSLANALQSDIDKGIIPERIAHNDAKFGNVMLDSETGKGICVIDLDTVMPGSVLFDFGDLVRSAAVTADEDEPDPSRVQFHRPFYEAVVSGYLEGGDDVLTQAETDRLVLSAQVITFETGLRFLTDFLDGDRYFRTTKTDHNLLRCRTQFALLAQMQANQDYMEDVVRATLNR